MASNAPVYKDGRQNHSTPGVASDERIAASRQALDYYKTKFGEPDAEGEAEHARMVEDRKVFDEAEKKKKRIQDAKEGKATTVMSEE